MFDFAKLAKFNLAKGSHEQPNENGDICINEAAIIAAGFEYKAVGSWKDCPPCFSKVIAQYAINLNDRMPDDLRNELLKPFVIQLSGTADTKEVELARVNYLVMETVRRINAYACHKWMGREDFAKRCEAITKTSEIKPLMGEIKAATAYADAAYADAAYAYAHAAHAAAYAADAAASAASAASAAYAYADASAAYAAYAYAYAYAADAADAAAAAAAADASAADARDKSLAMYAEWVVEILIAMDAPGCQWLDLVAISA